MLISSALQADKAKIQAADARNLDYVGKMFTVVEPQAEETEQYDRETYDDGLPRLKRIHAAKKRKLDHEDWTNTSVYVTGLSTDTSW